jgi:hypothetical protein
VISGNHDSLVVAVIGAQSFAGKICAQGLKTRHDWNGALADQRDRHRVGAHVLARDAAGGVGGADEDRLIKRAPKIELKCRRAYEVFGTLGCLGCGTELTRPRSSKKREPQSTGDTKILPMDLRVSDRLADETGAWEVIAPPYTTASGRIVHARVQKIDQPASWEIRSWDAFKRISVMRTTAEEGRRGIVP